MGSGGCITSFRPSSLECLHFTLVAERELCSSDLLLKDMREAGMFPISLVGLSPPGLHTRQFICLALHHSSSGPRSSCRRFQAWLWVSLA